MKKPKAILLGIIWSWPLSVWAQTPVTSHYGAAQSSTSSGSALIFSHIQQLREENARLRSLLESLQHEQQRQQQLADERYQGLEQRVLALESGSSKAGSGRASVVTESHQPVMSVSESPGDPAKEVVYYEAAFELVRARDFDRAAQALSAFLRKYPQGQYAGNAQYWLGEVALAQGHLTEARQAFERVEQYYGTHAKVPDALYKLGDVARRLGEEAQAQQLWQRVIMQYPDSSAAKLSHNQLDR